jgi:HEAT repeat protein
MKPLRLTSAVQALTLATLVLTSSLSAQEESHVSLTIGFAEGTSKFHVGEVIPVELSFKASTSDTYDMEMRNYDRSGRLNMEQFHVTPPGRDPLERYYATGAFIGGGLGGPHALSGEPQAMQENLNEWVALDKPGHYSLYVTSGRVSRRMPDKDEPVELRSNSLEFDVVAADPAWQQQTLTAAVTTLNMESSTDGDKAAALQILRFLDTPASVHELVFRLGTSGDRSGWNEVAGLAGSRYQNLVVQELEQQMSAPDVALTRNYLFILAKLKVQLDHQPLPPYPQKDVEQQKIWNERMQSREKDLKELQDGLYEKTATLVTTKRGAARAATVQTVLLRPSRGPEDVKPLAGLPAEEVAAAFLNLSEDQQWGLLMSFWERLKDPAMNVPLKKVAEQPNMKHQTLRDLALQCLYDLDPSEATPIFLEEIKHPHADNGMFTVRGETLGLLPNETLPQFDQMLAGRIEDKESRTKGLDAQLIGRYSTTAILPRVKSVYETAAGRWDCVTEDGFVSYFLRVDPDYGVKRLALAPSFCMINALPAVIRMRRWSEVEPGIVARLNGSDLNRARQAAEALAKYGSTEAGKALWERLRNFHEQWLERGNELVMRPGMPSDANEAVGFQFGLVEAIGKAQAWLLTNEKITELENLTLGQERDNVKQWHWSSPVNLTVSFFGEKMVANINQYSATDLTSLKTKLAQYPSGTKFWLNILGSPERVAPVRAAITDIAEEHGFDLAEPEK